MQQIPRMAALSAQQGEAALPTPPGLIRTFLAAHPALVNGTIVVCYLLGSALMLLIELFEPGMQKPQLWWWIPVCAAVAAALWLRTQHPMVGLVLTVCFSLVDLGYLQLANGVALVFFLYALPVYRGVRAGWFGYGIAAAGALLLVLITELMRGATGPDLVRALAMQTFVNGVWYLAVVVIGINMGNRRRYVSSLVAHAEHLVREREQQDALAAAAERARIAREMHDIIAHSLSVVVTLTEAASVTLERQPAAAQMALQRASETGRTALAEMRRLLGVLGDTSTADRAPQPQLTDLPQLCSGFADAGLRITRTESGVARADTGHQVAVYRIVQEALTNALRYAGRGADVQVDVCHTDTATTVTVTDSGQPAQGVPAGAGDDPSGQSATRGAPGSIPGSGRGIAGASQRAEMFGGALHAGPHGPGWRLRATVPYPETPARSTSGDTATPTAQKAPRA